MIEQIIASSNVERIFIITAEWLFIRCVPMLRIFEFKDNSKSASANLTGQIKRVSLNVGLTKFAEVHYIAPCFPRRRISHGIFIICFPSPVRVIAIDTTGM